MRIYTALAVALLATPAVAGDVMIEMAKSGNKGATIEFGAERNMTVAEAQKAFVEGAAAAALMLGAQNMKFAEHTDSVTALRIREAKPEDKFTVVDLDSPDRTVCIVKIGGECIFRYDGQTHGFVMTRTLGVESTGAPK